MKSYLSLHDGLSDMIEGGRLRESDIPTDYQWLVEKLAELANPLKIPDAPAECKADDAFDNPPCIECGAMTEEEAENKCICSGDKDDCHGCHLWPDEN